jgi:hypothetical protein
MQLHIYFVLMQLQLQLDPSIFMCRTFCANVLLTMIWLCYFCTEWCAFSLSCLLVSSQKMVLHVNDLPKSFYLCKFRHFLYNFFFQLIAHSSC